MRLMEVVINVTRPACRWQIPDTLIDCWKGMGNIKVMDKWRWNPTEIVYVVMFFILIIYSFDIFVLTFSRNHVTPPPPPPPTPSKKLIGSGQIVWPHFFHWGGGGTCPLCPPLDPRLVNCGTNCKHPQLETSILYIGYYTTAFLKWGLAFEWPGGPHSFLSLHGNTMDGITMLGCSWG